MVPVSYAVVLGSVCCSLLGGWGYFRCYTISRPPIGIFTFTDLALMMVMIILFPFLYLLLPLWLAAGLFVLSILSILYATWEPVVQARWAIWLVVLVLLALDVCAALFLGTHTDAFSAINNVVLLMVIIGIANLWAQSGMKARDVAILSGFLAVYDLITTTYLPLTNDLFTRLSGIPFTPMLSWGIGKSASGIGLGDMLLVTLFPLIMYKAFSRRAGMIAGVLELLAIGGMLALPFTTLFPAMVVLGPLMVLQYLCWSRRRGLERTTWQYLQEDPEKHRAQRFSALGRRQH
jgi:hypothetical protein